MGCKSTATILASFVKDDFILLGHVIEPVIVVGLTCIDGDRASDSS